MGANSKIEWTHHTFNPWIGCTHVHAGCTNCYAEAFAKRTGKAKWGLHGTRVVTSAANWHKPIVWNRDAEKAGERRRVFCASLADVFEDWDGMLLDHHSNRLKKPFGSGAADKTLDDMRAKLFTLIDMTPWLDWLLLTKRPENIPRMIPRRRTIFLELEFWRPNVWLGTSVSDQLTAYTMLPNLIKCRDLSPVLFVSFEPLLSPVSIRWASWDTWNDAHGSRRESVHEYDGARMIDWAIVGGESGHGRRECAVGDIVSLAEQCRAAGVPCFVKQDCSATPGQQGRIPDDVWSLKQFPEVTKCHNS